MARKNSKTAQTENNNDTVNEADLNAVVAQLDANEAQSGSTEQSDADPATVQSAPAEDLMEIVNAIDDDARQKMAREIGESFDTRAAFESAKNPNNTTIHSSLNKSRAKLAMPSAAAFLAATNVAPDFINRQVSSGSAYNVYAADKLADLVGALRDGIVRNAINNAVCRSLFKFRAAGEQFTGDMAKAAASDKIRISGNLQKLLVRHTVSAGTAPTQSSSTLTALQTLGIVVNKGSQKYPIYELTDTPQTKRLEEVLAA